MILLMQAAINLLLGFTLNNKLFALYCRAAFFVFPVIAVIYTVSSPMVRLAMSDNADPTAIAFDTNMVSLAFLLILITLAVQAVFHFFVFKLIRNRRTN